MTTSYNLTDNARETLAAARDHAGRLRHDAVTPDHLLLGIISMPDTVAATALSRLGVNVEDLGRTLAARLAPGTAASPGTEPPHAPDTARVLELATQEARELNHVYIGSEHLLLALVSEGSSAAAAALAEQHVAVERLRAIILHLLGSDRQSLMTQRPPS